MRDCHLCNRRNSSISHKRGQVVQQEKALNRVLNSDTNGHVVCLIAGIGRLLQECGLIYLIPLASPVSHSVVRRLGKLHSLGYPADLYVALI